MPESSVADFHEALNETPRLLMEVGLTPVQGDRFQPTGFPDLGPARYTGADGSTQMILVESAQSVANRMELTCWDAPGEKLIAELEGLPYIRVNGTDGQMLTSSIHSWSGSWLKSKKLNEMSWKAASVSLKAT